ncbi:ATP-dependent sacrificial sulfur transferase LarE [Planctomycetales bacterium 10988]|nr:ATP-dependent sacrificial sulfur transferase LarE [Planctomycetales bacterium 10988]
MNNPSPSDSIQADSPSQSEQLSPSLVIKRDQLVEMIRNVESCVVAFSGGVDSAVVAKAAALALGEQAIAVTASSASLAGGELEQATELARQIGIRHEVLYTEEFDSPAYRQNAKDRCYHCKSELYRQLENRLDEYKVKTMLAGANADDVGDYRPGMQAASERNVRNPLLECRITKQEVRDLAFAWNLPVWNKPATPCLSSRVAYGLEVTPERLKRIDQAEQYLREQGFPIVRVRCHPGELARIEIPGKELPRLLEENLIQEVSRELKALGFSFVTLDLEGFRSGSMNKMHSLTLPILQ